MTPEALAEVAAQLDKGRKTKVLPTSLPAEAVLFCPDCGDVHRHKLVIDPKKPTRVAVQCLKCEKVAAMTVTAVTCWFQFRKAKS